MEILINAKDIDIEIEEQFYSKPRLKISESVHMGAQKWVIYIEDIEQIKDLLIDHLQDMDIIKQKRAS